MKKQSKGISFKNQTVFAGIDVHKKNWKVTTRMNHMELKTFSMQPGATDLHKHLQRNYPEATYKSAYEAGFCGFYIHEELISLGIENIVVNPADIPTTHKEKSTKTDTVDSRKIARHLENNELTGIYVPENKSLQIRSLCRLRERLVSHRTRIQNRIKSHLAMYGIFLPENHELKHWSAKFIKYLESLCDGNKPGLEYLSICIDELKGQRERILHTLRSLRTYLKVMPAWDNVIKNLLSIPGVGFITAATLYTEIIDINRFKKLDNLASFVGLVPFTHSSGEHEQIGGVTSRRNKHLRHMIIEAAWVAIRSDPSLLKSYNDLSLRMKNSQAIVRIARKLLNRIRFVWVNETPYQCFVN